MNPLVSVVVTTYNQAPYIEQALKSVLAQSYQPYEVIVVDDGSTDDTPSRIAAFAERVIYVRQENQGVAGSRNAGIRRARGEYLAFLDGDDLWEPEKLAVQVAQARRHPDSGLIAVDGIQFDEKGTLETTLFYGAVSGQIPEGSVSSGSYYHRLLQSQFIYTTSQVMIPARVLASVGLSDPRFRRASDYDLYIRIAARFDITIVRRRLTRWRYLASSASGPMSLRLFNYLLEDIAILKKHRLQTRGEDRELVARIIDGKTKMAGEKLYRYGLESDRSLATSYLFKLMAENPLAPAAPLLLAGLWCPEVIRKRIAPAVRGLFSSEVLP